MNSRIHLPRFLTWLAAQSRMLLLGAVIFIGSEQCLGQQNFLTSLQTKFDHYRKETLQEKLFVHTDRAFYLTGETMWFKVYDVDASFQRPLDLSKIVYLEILDKDNHPVLQTKIGIQEGKGSGTFFLPTSLNAGHYWLRAYTQWMRNFNPDLYFYQQITVVNPFSRAGLKPPDGKPHYDIQFFPEGGLLVSDLKSTIGFRAVDMQGKGINFRGAVLDEKNDTVTNFQPMKFGIGNFSFVPSSIHSYKAIIRDTQGNTVTCPFPSVSREGYVIHVQDTNSNQVVIHISSQFVNSTELKPFIYFLAHTRQALAAATVLFLEHGKTQLVIDKNELGEGISHFTIFTSTLQPVCERLYFKQPGQSSVLEIHTDQSQYTTRKKIDLSILAHDPNGNPANFDLSVSVYKTDSLQNSYSSDIVSSVWLTSELREIEDPEYYLKEGSKNTEAVDNLMLTHGWSRFRWEDILSNKKKSFEFTPEYHGQIIHGLITDINTGIPGDRVITYLSTPGKNIRLNVSRSDTHGKVQYEMQDFVGARRIIAQTNSQIDSTFRIDVVSPFSEIFPNATLPPFDLSENLKGPIASRSFQMQIQNSFYDENPNHIDVPTIDSVAFYGKPDEHYYLEDFTRFPTMEEVMREYIPGVLVRKRKGRFHFMTLDRTNKSVFRNDPMVLLDGIPVFDIDKIMAFDPRKIKKLDVLTQQYFLGSISLDGLVSYTTYKGDLSDFQLDARTLVSKYDGIQWKREFFTPRYASTDEQKGRVPDMRNLLYWSPDVNTHQQGKKKIEFYSSDIPGHYIAVVQGITKEGVAGIGTTTFTVLEPDHF